jgi:hypothetical protein
LRALAAGTISNTILVTNTGEPEKQIVANDNVDEQGLKQHCEAALPLHEQNLSWTHGIRDKRDGFKTMSPMFQCLICRQTIERSTRAYWKHKGHLLCSTCKDNIEAEVGQSRQQTPPRS